MLPIKALQERVSNSELGREWTNDPLMNQDIWSFEELGYTEESKIKGVRNIYFEKFSLPWLKLLAKLTTKATAREKCSLGTIQERIYCLRKLDKFLVSKNYNQPELITDTLLQEFAYSNNNYADRRRHSTIIYVTKLWSEEGWLKLSYTPPKYKQTTPKVEIIPEEVLHQIYENFDLFPPPLERLFRLQLVLGCRIGELLRMPRQCLKKEGDKWFLLRWIQKRKHYRFYQIHSLLAELIQEQQKFLDTQFGCDCDFDKLFCRLSTASYEGATSGKRFEVEPIYFPEVLANSIITNWLKDFREKANLKDKYGNRFNLKSHMFRRTKASIMAYSETEDEYIAAMLGHSTLDMLPHYRNRSLERLEKEAKVKGYVDKYGRITTFKPKKRRYEELVKLLKVTISSGECHRPTMLGDCQYRYACLSCEHHRVTLEDKPQIEADIADLEKDLELAQAVGKERRVEAIYRLLGLLKTRLEGLEKLANLKREKADGKET